MIEPNITWLETLVGDYINISTIHKLYFTRGSKGKLFCVVMDTQDDMRHELIPLPDEGDIIKCSAQTPEFQFKFESKHAHMLVHECASTISEWGRSILTNEALTKLSWASMELFIKHKINLITEEEKKGDNFED